MTYSLTDFFCGAGGSSQGAASVPGVEPQLAANHWDRAIESHAANFPDTEHYQGDLHDVDVAIFRRGDIFWASPECTEWTQAKGNSREFDKQPDLFGETLPPSAADRSRALMWDVPRYLEAMKLRGNPVLAGVVENVVEARQGIHWHEWVRAIQNLGYRTKLIAFNSMHARPARTPMAPQSRDRLYLAYWLTSVRTPDWDKWLRPPAYCSSCEAEVRAVQSWKKSDVDMGRYRQQYVYRCPHVACRGQIVEPAVLPAAYAIDWSNPGQRIGDRDRPLAPKTIARIEAGLRKYAVPISLEAAGNTFERRPGVRTWPVTWPLTTQTATESKAIACPPMIVPAGGTWRKDPTTVDGPMPTRTSVENDALACPPFFAILRGQSSTHRADDPLSTVTSMGAHHGLCVPPFLTPLRSGRPRTIPVDDPMATVTAGGGNHGLVVPPFMTMLRGAGNSATSVDEPLATLMSGNNHYLTVPPFITVSRGEELRTLPVTDPLAALTASSNPFGIAMPGAMVMRNNGSKGDGGEHCTSIADVMRALTTKGHQSLVCWDHLLVPYYGTGVAHSVSEPAGTMTGKARFGLASPAIDVNDVLFRMLEPHEIGAAMAFYTDYVVLGSKREQVRQYGNAVTPPVAEILVSALVEALNGDPMDVAA